MLREVSNFIVTKPITDVAVGLCKEISGKETSESRRAMLAGAIRVSAAVVTLTLALGVGVGLGALLSPLGPGGVLIGLSLGFSAVVVGAGVLDVRVARIAHAALGIIATVIAPGPEKLITSLTSLFTHTVFWLSTECIGFEGICPEVLDDVAEGIIDGNFSLFNEETKYKLFIFTL